MHPSAPLAFTAASSDYELERLIDEHLAANVAFETFVHRKSGKPFTRDGIGGMFRRYCGEDKANVKDFGLRDLCANLGICRSLNTCLVRSQPEVPGGPNRAARYAG
jgi:hypothetical protein